MRKMTPDHGAGDGDVDFVTVADAHDFHVLAPGGVVPAPVSSVDRFLDGENEVLQWTQGGIADTDRRVVGERRPTGLAVREQRLQVLRAGIYQYMQADMSVRVQRMQIGAEPFVRALHGDFGDREDLTAHFRNRAPGQIDIDGGEDGAAAERRGSAPADQQRLIDVVMKNLAEVAPVLTTKIA